MRTRRHYSQVSRQTFRPELQVCPFCQTRLKRAVTLSQRSIITLEGVIQLDHRGYRCPNVQCEQKHLLYRSAAADALALPTTWAMSYVQGIGRKAPGRAVNWRNQFEGEGMGEELSRSIAWRMERASSAISSSGIASTPFEESRAAYCCCS